VKIGFVLDDTLDSSDGVQQYVLTLGKWLSDNGHQVHYLVGQTSRTDIQNIHSLAKNFRVKFNRNVLSIPLWSRKKQIAELLETEKFDCLHVQLPFSPLLAGRVIKLAPASTRIIGTFHILPFNTIQTIAARLLGWLTRSSLRKIDQVVSVSPAAQEFAKRSMGIESVVIPNAVDLARFSTSNKLTSKFKKSGPRNSKRIVFLGRLVQRKGCYQLLQALLVLKQQGRLDGVLTTIAGDGPDRARLRHFVEQHQMSDNVNFIGRIDEADKASLLASADIVALPSISGESFGIVVVEAIASGGGVVVGGRNPGYSYVLADTPETLIDPLDTNSFADCLGELLKDSSKRQQLAKAQRSLIKKFDVAVVGKKIVDLYQAKSIKHE
jgi:phosphatidylinositol alpha-mannosyltransferase